MSPGRLSAKVVADRLSWIRRMNVLLATLPLESLEAFTENRHIPASAESYLRRGLEALFDLGRHLLAKGFGRSDTEYKEIARGLFEVGILDAAMSRTLVEMAGYRNRLVHFYHEVTTEELYHVCVDNLSDIEVIAQLIRQWIQDHPQHIDEEL
jgi:uncharacterized protein YutE (UPF0331/DUF86 family)